MSAEALGCLIVEELGCRLLDGSVHALGLAIGPRMIRLGQPVLDAVLLAHPIERMLHGVVLGGSVLGERVANPRSQSYEIGDFKYLRYP